MTYEVVKYFLIYLYYNYTVRWWYMKWSTSANCNVIIKNMKACHPDGLRECPRSLYCLLHIWFISSGPDDSSSSLAPRMSSTSRVWQACSIASRGPPFILPKAFILPTKKALTLYLYWTHANLKQAHTHACITALAHTFNSHTLMSLSSE